MHRFGHKQDDRILEVELLNLVRGLAADVCASSLSYPAMEETSTMKVLEIPGGLWVGGREMLPTKEPR